MARSDAVTLANSISGSGTLVQNGTGVLTLTATNSYTGVTAINTGTVVFATGVAATNSTVLVNVNDGLAFGAELGRTGRPGTSRRRRRSRSARDGSRISRRRRRSSGFLRDGGSDCRRNGRGRLLRAGGRTHTLRSGGGGRSSGSARGEIGRGRREFAIWTSKLGQLLLARFSSAATLGSGGRWR